MTAINLVKTVQESDTSVITEDDLLRLPAPIQRYMRYSGVVGRPPIKTAIVKYAGKFRLGPGQPWMHLVAEQFYTVNPPGFLWKAQFKAAGLPIMFGQDIYKNGHSRMHGKLLGLFTVVDGQGDEVDQGAMVRYLLEIPWFPTAYLEENISWQEIDDHAADVTLDAFGQQVTGRMFFDDAGRLLNFRAQRYGEFQGKFVLHTWSTPITEYGSFAGLNLPCAGTATWLLPSGDLPYIQYRLKEVIYNRPVPAVLTQKQLWHRPGGL
jgi:hypothetical protein